MSQLEILASFDQDVRPVSAADVIERTGLPRSTVFRGLKMLMGDGFVRQDQSTKRYTLGPRVLQLGMVAKRQLGPEDIIVGPLMTLAQRTGETVTFSILDVPLRICVYVLEATSDLRHVVQVGARYPLHLGAAGKVILAHLSKEVSTSILDSQSLSKAQVASIRTDLETIRTQGWAITTGERVAGALAIAAPVFVAGSIYGSVAVVGPSERMLGGVETHRPPVVEAAARITERLSAKGPSASGSNGQRLRS